MASSSSASASGPSSTRTAQPVEARRLRAPSSIALSLRSTSSHGMVLDFPERMSSSRRLASATHAASISSSEWPSPMLSARMAARFLFGVDGPPPRSVY